MATVKGFIRSYGAAVRRAERDQQRQARNAAKRYKQQLKQEEISNAGEAVANYSEYIELIQSVHKNCTEKIDWNQIKNTPIPEKPRKEISNEATSQQNLNNYRPSIFDKLFGSANKKINRLEELLEKAKKKDIQEYELVNKKYLDEIEDWEFLQKTSKGLEKENPESYKDALQYFNPFSDIGELGTRIEFSISEKQVDVDVHISGEEVIPSFEFKQLASGKLSKKSMTKSKFNEIYQDHICSSVIRVSRELFAYLPIKKARVNAIGQVLNSSTGHLEERTILSVIMVRETINSLNMETIDPSDSMQNFVHNMKFVKTKGFSPVEKVELI
jgi:hypothetical protein